MLSMNKSLFSSGTKSTLGCMPYKSYTGKSPTSENWQYNKIKILSAFFFICTICLRRFCWPVIDDFLPFLFVLKPSKQWMTIFHVWYIFYIKCIILLPLHGPKMNAFKVSLPLTSTYEGTVYLSMHIVILQN